MFEKNVFCLDDEEYKQHIDPITDYINQAAYYLSKQSNYTIEECKALVTDHLKKSKNIINPKVTYLERQSNGDRIEKETNLTSYIGDALSSNSIIAPTFTTYIHPTKKRSFIATNVINNIKRRYVSKKAAFEEDAKGNTELAIIKDNEQTNFKLTNNAFSGAHCTPSTPFYNKSAHSTLTSTTRLTASIANANNEKLITGNRHYWSKDVVFNNITSIISNTDLNQFKSMMDEFNLVYPTVEDTLKVILYSTELYWHSLEFNNEIKEYLSCLSDVELAAFVYTNDLYQVKELNPDFMRTFFKELTLKCSFGTEDRLELVKTIPGDLLNLSHQIWNKEVKGLGKDYKQMEEKGILDLLVSTAINIQNFLYRFRNFITTIMVNTNIPASVAFFPRSIRRSVVASDTDSTIFTVQEWVKWFYGKYVVDDESIALSASLVFIAERTIYHILAIISANCNYERTELHRLAMKNEFRFDVFVPTQVSKHYFAIIGCREGNVFPEYKTEIKGVHLKNSNLPKDINNTAADLMKRLMFDTANNKEIKLKEILDFVLNIENEIYDSLIKGESDFYRTFKLKDPTSYKLSKEKSPYIHHMFWQEVFEDKYGKLDEPPYSCIKLSTTLHNKSSILEFINQIKDDSIKTKFQNFIEKYNKTSLKTIMISKSYVNQHGLPQELVPLINSRKTILDVCNIFYIILETLGYYKKPYVTLRDIQQQQDQGDYQ